MASITFYLDRVKDHDPKSKTQRSIFIYITWKGNRIRKFSGHKVRECDWVPSIQRLNPKITGSKNINEGLQKKEDFIESLFQRSDFNPTVENLKSMIEAGEQPEKDFFSLFDDFIKDSQSRLNKKGKLLSSATVQDYESAKTTIKEFQTEKKFPISFQVINSNFYSKFRAYCLEDKKYKPSYFGAKIKKLKTFLFWCQDMDIVISNRFHSFEVPGEYGDIEPIFSEELLELWNKEFNSQYQIPVDVFLALCSTGMRISDYNRVMTNMDKYLTNTSEGKALIFKAQKTEAQCIVPFYDDLYFRPEYLYNKYKGKMPRLSGDKLNQWLDNFDLLGGRIHITSKTGRKTMCSIKYFEQGIESQYIMSITGHKSEGEFKKYLGSRPSSIIKGNRDKGTFMQKAI